MRRCRWPWRYIRVRASLEYGSWSYRVDCGPTIWGPFWSEPAEKELEKAREVIQLQRDRPDFSSRNPCGWEVTFYMEEATIGTV